jgi:hypothetical protein
MLPSLAPFLIVMALFWLLGFESEGQGCKPGPSLGISPLGRSDELLHFGLDMGLDARYNTCLRVDLEEHGMVQGEDLRSKFVVGGDVQDGMPGRGHGLQSYSFVVEEGPGIQVRLPGQGRPVDRGVLVVEVFGILEQTSY